MYKAEIKIDGIVEASVTGDDKEMVLSQAGLYFSQYAEDFTKTIILKVTKTK